MNQGRPSPLGLFGPDDERPNAEVFVRGAVDPLSAEPPWSLELPGPAMRLTVIVPARNEEAVIGDCLESLLVQDDAEIFTLGREWELLVVDDASTDATGEIVARVLEQREGAVLFDAPPLDSRPSQYSFTGKTNACWAAAQKARGDWLLFTDADTLHAIGDLQRSLHEAEKYQVKLLSYSPRQITAGFAQRLLMPLVFSELASVYPPSEINNPSSKMAAANGQFLLVERKTYFAVGGHRAVGKSILEDVDLAWNVKRAAVRGDGNGIRLRFAPDAVAARMYRSFGDMVEGWSKNLTLLFPHALALAAWRLLDVLLLLLPALLFLIPRLTLLQQGLIILLWLRTIIRFYRRVARSNFGFLDCALSPLGLPLLIAILLRSWIQHKLLHNVEWKDRTYRIGP